jgi:hypothetical protein
MKAAELDSRKDLVQLWSLVQILMDSSVYRSDQKDTLMHIPWTSHPMASKMVSSL